MKKSQSRKEPKEARSKQKSNCKILEAGTHLACSRKSTSRSTKNIPKVIPRTLREHLIATLPTLISQSSSTGTVLDNMKALLKTEQEICINVRATHENNHSWHTLSRMS